jgi:PAS domain S-box-containing protein
MNFKPLRLLLAENRDDPSAELMTALVRAGHELEEMRAGSLAEFREALRTSRFDLVLAADPNPDLDVLEALAVLESAGQGTPLMMISRSADGALAMEAMRQGAFEVWATDDSAGFAAAVERVLRNAATRRQMALAEKVFQSQSEILEMILDRVPVSEVLNQVVTRVEALVPGELMGCIMLANADGTVLEFGAGPSLPAGFRKRLEAVPLLEGHGSCGTAAALGRPDIVADVSSHPGWACVRDLAEEAGIRSCWSLPVFSPDRRVLGTLSVYHRSANIPTEAEMEWMVAGTRLVSLAVLRGFAAEQLRQSEELFQIASEAALIGGWTVDLPDKRVTWSDQVRAIHEVDEDFVPTFENGMGFFAPEHRERFQEVFRKCCEGGAYNEELPLITATGKQVWVRTIGKAIRNRDGEIFRIQGAFQDITLEKQAELAEEVRRSNERRYLSQRNALISLTAGIPPEQPDLMGAFRRITEASGRTLEVAQTSIWRYAADLSLIVCLDQFDLESGEHSSGATLLADDYRNYFDILSQLEIIAADDACEDPATREFAQSYLIPNGVTSTMDLPIRFGRSVSYFICNEHIGPVRQWTSDEKTFGIAIANHISLALESHERARAQAEVLKSHQWFQAVAAATNDTLWDWNLETDAFWWYDGSVNLFGRSAADSEASVHVWIRQIHLDDRDRVVKGIYGAIDRGETHWSDEYRFVSFDGRVTHVRDRGEILRGQSGRAIRMVGGMTDLTESKAAEEALGRSHRALRMLSSCNEMLVRTSSETELLAEVCRLAVEVGGYRMAWVGYAGEDTERRVVPMAHAGHEAGYLSDVDIFWSDEKVTGQGPVGRAIRSGTTVVIPDLSADPTFRAWLRNATERGYSSMICLALHNKVRPFGVLCLYGAEVHQVGSDEMNMLREMANDLAFGIENIRSREERNRAQDVVVKVAQAVSSGVGSEFFELLTRNTVEAMDAHGGLIGRFDPVANSVETISFFLNGKQMDNVTYGLEGTPCAEVAAGEACVFESGVQQLFPKDHLLVQLGIESYVGIPLMHRDGTVAGIMVVFFAQSIRETALVMSTLSIFATRAASELDRQQAEARIREQASLLDKARDAIIVRGLDHRITFWNKGAQRLYGWRAEEALGRLAQELIYQDLAEFTKAHEQTLAYGEWTGELRQVDRDGRQLTIEGRWTLVRDEQGRPESVFALNTDISQQRELEQQFLRAQRMESIGTLAGGIAHDLNNILAPISMSIELLQMRVTDVRSQELLATIATSARRGSEMIGQVLSFARGVDGRQVDIHPLPVIREIESILRDTILRGIRLEVVADRDLWIIRGDPTQIHQVILNLCVNARDAVRDDGKIAIIASNVEIDSSFAAMNLEAGEGPHVCIEVRDSGAGIPVEIMDRIFDPFFTTKSSGKGTGLGLSTSQAIVRSHGGFIRISSTPGEGSRFRVYLPAAPEVGSGPLPGEDHELPRGAGETILVVDDEAAIREVTRRTLEAFGYHVMVASTGDEALRLFKDCPLEIDVVLTDMMMPGMDGPTTISQLREINPRVRIIATSGIRSNRDLIASTSSSPVVFLEKPHTSAVILECLHRLLNRAGGIR